MAANPPEPRLSTTSAKNVDTTVAVKADNATSSLLTQSLITEGEGSHIPAAAATAAASTITTLAADSTTVISRSPASSSDYRFIIPTANKQTEQNPITTVSTQLTMASATDWVPDFQTFSFSVDESDTNATASVRYDQFLTEHFPNNVNQDAWETKRLWEIYIQKYKNGITSLEKNNRELENKQSKHMKTLGKLRQTLESLKKEREQLKTNLESSIKKREDALAQKELEFQKLRNELAASKQNAETLQKANQGLKHKMETQEKRLTKLKKRLEASKNYRQQLSAEKKDLDDQLANSKKGKESLALEISGRDAQHKALIAQKDAEISGLKNELADLVKKYSELKSKIKEYDCHLFIHKQSLKDAQTNYDELKSRLNSMVKHLDSKISDLTKRNSFLEHELSNATAHLMATLSQKDLLIANLNNQLQAMSTKISFLSGKLNITESQLKQTETRSNQRESQLTTLELQMKAQQAIIKQQEEQITSLKKYQSMPLSAPTHTTATNFYQPTTATYSSIPSSGYYLSPIQSHNPMVYQYGAAQATAAVPLQTGYNYQMNPTTSSTPQVPIQSNNPQGSDSQLFFQYTANPQTATTHAVPLEVPQISVTALPAAATSGNINPVAR